MYAIQVKEKNNYIANWEMCYNEQCDGKRCPCVFMFRGDAEIDMVGKIGIDDEHQYRIMPCELHYY